MALTNWFIVLWNEYGESIRPGSIVKVGDVKVEIYKNKIFLYYEGQKIATIWEGVIEAWPIEISAKRGLQFSVYFMIKWYEKKGDDLSETHYLFGIAGDGYDDLGNWVGCLPETIKDFKDWAFQEFNRDLLEILEDEKFLEQLSRLSGEPVEKIREEERQKLKYIPWKPGKIYNQGDLYFSEALGFPDQYQLEGCNAPRPYFEIMLFGSEEENNDG